MLQSAVRSTPFLVRPLQDQLTLRETIRTWLENVIASHGVTARKVAVQSGIAPSTIYRALEEGGDFVMSTTILAKISNAFGEPMPTGMGGAAAQVPARGFADLDLVAYVGPAPDMPTRPEDNHYRARVMSDVLNLEHIRPGDVLDFDMSIEPRAGDIVVAQHYNRATAAETVLRVYQPPYLLTRSSNPAIDQRPMLVDNERVKIMGTFVRLVRDRAI